VPRLRLATDDAPEAALLLGLAETSAVLYHPPMKQMKAMILAAGRGERMRPLTDTTPKPLLPVADKPLIVWHLERLAAAGFRDVVINHAWLGHQLEAALGDGSRWGVHIHWSPEPSGGLGTAGGIVQALPLLGDAPFLVVNGDIWCDWQPQHASSIARALTRHEAHAWLLMVDNPAHHPDGDFWLEPAAQQTAAATVSTASPSLTGASERLAFGHITATPAAPCGASRRLTFSGVGIYRPELFAGIAAGKRLRLASVLTQAMATQSVIGSHHSGCWIDVGTPARLQQLDSWIRERAGEAKRAGAPLRHG